MIEALSCTRGFACRRRASLALAVISLVWSSSGCAVTVRSHDVRPTGPEHTQRNSLLLWGTVGEADVSIERICGADKRAASTGVSHDALDVALFLLTLGIYSPQSAHVQCGVPVDGAP